MRRTSPWFVVVVWGALLFLGSCQVKDTAESKRIDDLERRIADLEARFSGVETTTKSMNDKFTNIEEKFSLIEQMVKPLEQTLSKLVGSTPTPASEPQTQPTTGTVSGQDVPDVEKTIKSLLILENWSYRVVKGEFSGHNYEFTYTLKNGFTKGIKLIDGSIHFKDLLGERLYGIRVTPDLKIPAGKNKTDSGQWKINPYIADDQRMMSMDKKDVIAELQIRQIVFDDNTILKF